MEVTLSKKSKAKSQKAKNEERTNIPNNQLRLVTLNQVVKMSPEVKTGSEK